MAIFRTQIYILRGARRNGICGFSLIELQFAKRLPLFDRLQRY